RGASGGSGTGTGGSDLATGGGIASGGMPGSEGSATGGSESGGSTAMGGAGGGERGTTCESPINVSDVVSLRAALASATAGDCISLAPGTYLAPDTTSVNYAGLERSLYFFSQ